MKTGLALFVIAISTAAVYAYADTGTLVQSAKPAARIYSGRTINVLGIAPAMSADQAIKILTQVYGKPPQVQHSSLAVQYQGITMSSQEYVSELDDALPTLYNSDGTVKASDTIHVYFSTPSTGDTVVGVFRDLTYGDPKTEPKATEIQTSLQTKYGPASQTQQNGSSLQAGTEDLWSFNDKSQNQCNGNCYMNVFPLYDPTVESLYQQSVSKNIMLLLDASLTMQQNDSSRVSRLTVSLSDEGSKLLTTTEALKQLTTLGAAAYNKAPAAAAPNL